MVGWAGILLAGGLLGGAPEPAATPPNTITTAPTVTAQAHLTYRLAPSEPPVEAEVAVIETRPADWNLATRRVWMRPCLIRRARPNLPPSRQDWRCGT
jgi:hypothetical protein